MWPTSYSKRLAHDLETWRAKGWVTPENATAIRASLEGGETTSRLPVIITVLGAVLIGFSAMAFVAANWTDMSKALRLSLLAIAMWSAYGTAAVLYLRQQSGFAEAALLIGVGVFGASIMLVGQMYHLPSDFSAGFLVWSLGALLTAWVVRSKSALIAAQLLLMGWTSNEFDGALHFSYLVPWAAAAALATRLNWEPAKHLALIGLIFWLFGNAPSLAETIGWGPFELLSLLTSLFAILWLIGIAAEQKGKPFARALQGYGGLALLVLFWIAQLVDEELQAGSTLIVPALGTLIVFALAFLTTQRIKDANLTDALALAAFPAGILIIGLLVTPDTTVPLWFSAPFLLILCVWLIAFATRLQNRFLINLGFAGFGGEALYLYLETFGTLLDTAAFFAIGGVLLIAGGFVWERLRRRATAAQTEASS